jgi:capsular polysaccharide biosynthesis protein
LYFSDAIAVVVRRWYVVVVAAVVMIAGAAVVIAVVPTEYQASGQVLLLPPAESAVGADRINPYLNLPNGVTFTATLLASGAMQRSVARDLVEGGFESAYSVSVVPGTGPLIVISVKDTDGAAALALRDELIVRIESELTRIQQEESVPDSQQIVARRFNSSSVAEVLAGSKIRALGALLALGTVTTAVVLFGFDRWRTRRRGRRTRPPDTNSLDEQGPDPQDLLRAFEEADLAAATQFDDEVERMEHATTTVRLVAGLLPRTSGRP